MPDDIAVASFDDIPEAAQQDPPLTTIRVPKEAMGETAVHHLIRIMKDPDTAPLNIQLFSELIVRESTVSNRRAGNHAIR